MFEARAGPFGPVEISAGDWVRSLVVFVRFLCPDIERLVIRLAKRVYTERPVIDSRNGLSFEIV